MENIKQVYVVQSFSGGMKLEADSVQMLQKDYLKKN